MTDQLQLDPETLASYLAGEASPEEQAAITQWVDGNPSAQRWLTETRTMWATLPPEDVPPLDLEAFRSVVTNRIQSGTRPRPFSMRPSRRGVWGTMTKIATVVVLVAFAWFGGTERITSALSDSNSIYTTGNGERATVTLPDGSIVTLNVGSRLEVPSDYAAGTRTVRLNGEALFTVVHQSKTPFTVIAGPSTTRVLGTSFVVRHYATDSAAFIAVRDGKVAVGKTTVAANQQVFVGAQGIGRVQASGAMPFGFVRGILMFENTALRDAIPALNRWYDVEIRIGDSVLDTRQITGEFSAGAVSELTEILEWTFNMRVVRSGRILTLFPRG